MLYPNSLVFMQRLQQAAGYGQYYYVEGEADLPGYERLAKKFAIAYETDLSRQTKHRRRRSGETTSTFFAMKLSMYPNGEGQIPVRWVLLATDGIGRVHEREQLRDLRKPQSRLTAGGRRYELIHDGKCWTWRLSHRAENDYLNRIHRIAALPKQRRRVIEIDGVRRDADAEKLLDELYSVPGFRMVRRQVGRLVSEFRREWKRLRADSGVRLSERTFLPYVRFMANEPHAECLAPPRLTQAEREALFQLAFSGK
ncbi:hypothetical protein OL229_10490 [Neisseriaceae bacterium JH1-16]|nr:hypothetical protein [Neisseriaceae bacterium JH1-16]